MSQNFTPAEKKVLLGLVEHPRLNDRELSEEIDVKPSTTTAIRRRLREKGVFRTKRIPMGHKLGYEILAVGYGRFRSALDAKQREAFQKWVRGIPYVFLSLECTEAVFNTAYFKNYGMFREYTDAVAEKFKHSDMFDSRTWVPVIFGFDTCKLLSFFDYGPAVRHAFGIKKEVKPDLEFEKPLKERLTKKEKSVLRGLVVYPESSDKRIAEKIGASRQAVSSMKKRFEDSGILRTVRIVNLKEIGYSLLAMAHSVFAPHATIKVRSEGIKMIQETIPSILNVASNPENVLFTPTEDYDEYHELRKEALKLYMGKGFLHEEPEITLFPLSDTMTTKDYDFSGFVDIIAAE